MMFISLERFCARIQSVRGARSYGLSALFGALLTLSFPPFWLLPIGLAALVCLIWQVEAAHSLKQAFWHGWWFGLGHFVSGFYWITIALGVDGGTFLWLVPFALLLLPSYTAIYIGLASMSLRIGVHYLRPAGAVILFAVMWVLMEYVRSWLMTGFPWNLLGYVWTLHDVTLQTSAVVGVYGLSFWTVMLAGGFSLLAKPVSQRNFLLPVVLAITTVLLVWGGVRISNAIAMHDSPAEAVNVRIVQANANQSEKWDPKLQVQTVRRHLDISSKPSELGELDYIVWPETAMPFAFEEGTQWAEILARHAPTTGAIITGVVRYEDGPQGQWQAWNSIQAINSAGEILGVYDKNKLVPFGEFLPLRWLLSTLGLEKVAHGMGDFSRGPGPQTLPLSASQARIIPLICYEAIFPLYQPKHNLNADWMLNITNDEWFGRSTGPHQHLHMARTRAVEQGMPLVRAANSGISAVFDAYGQEQKRLGLGEIGVVDVRIPVAPSVPTWYKRHGEYSLLAVLLFSLGYAWSLRIRKQLE